MKDLHDVPRQQVSPATPLSGNAFLDQRIAKLFADERTLIGQLNEAETRGMNVELRASNARINACLRGDTSAVVPTEDPLGMDTLTGMDVKAIAKQPKASDEEEAAVLTII